MRVLFAAERTGIIGATEKNAILFCDGVWYNRAMKENAARIKKRILAFRLEWKPMVKTLLIMLAATALSFVLHEFFIQNNNVSMIYALAVVAVSCVTPGYFYGVVASLISVIGVNYFFTLPYWAFNFSMTGYPITFFIMLITSIITSTLVTGYRERERAWMEMDKEKLRSNLLRAISHDLRTPLTSISGASSLLLYDWENIDEKNRSALLNDIRENSEWLVRMVENLLSVTKMYGEGGGIQKVPDMAEDIGAHAVLQVRRRFPEQKIDVIASAEPFEVPMDSTLIEQVIINLIENAIYHSGSSEAITVRVEEKGGKAAFTVRDHGKGVDVGRMMRIMDGYVETDRPGDKDRGMGIGLSLCSSIVKAHGGKMTVENALDGGAVFGFVLPMEKGE